MDELAIRRHVERSRAGDTDAFAELFRLFRTDVQRLCRRMLASRDESDDAASEVFLRAHRALDAYDTARPFRSWLLAIAAHHCVDRLRRRTTESRLFEPGDFDPDRIAAPGPSPLQQRLTEEVREHLLAALEALPDRYRAPLVLRYFAGFDYSEIGEVLDVSRNQVATLLFRAKRKLREQFDSADAQR